MYYPYIRGRQYELLALKELVLAGQLSEHITPIIEPVRFNPTLVGTLGAFVDKARTLLFVDNPQVGLFSSEFAENINDRLKVKYYAVRDARREDLSRIIKRTYIYTDTIAEVLKGKEPINNVPIINTNSAYLEHFKNQFSQEKALLVFRPDGGVFRRATDRQSQQKVLLEDYFKLLFTAILTTGVKMTSKPSKNVLPKFIYNTLKKS
ncbi:MAG: sce7725 family protein [Akkermansia sp.]